ncbi:helicase associated domain-containing protein [Pseudoclavibacter soli]|uniref:helicase associated domain-containing protein n=1 Tax=Pseudoclavibacter soli TaxID=452623 RepID=UPI000415D6A6|nr:helicase associated domain-containing protein [Pseudoclavibacter soli]
MSAITETERYTLALREQVRAGTADHTDVQLADRLLPGWRAEYPLGDTWLRHLLDVSEFHIEHGRFPTRSELEGAWLNKQRQAAKKGTLSPERHALLDQQLPGWNVALDDVWRDHLTNVVALHTEHGRFPTRPEPEGQLLVDQRQAARKGTLSPERRALLDQQLPGWDSTRVRPFEDRLVAVVAFRAEHGRLPKQTEPGGMWLNNQRQAAKKGKLSLERRSLLDQQLPGWDLIQNRPFEDRLAAVVAFHAEHGRFPKKSEPEGVWLQKQRHAAKHGTLSPERRALLDAELPCWDVSA